jgi:hypothetical protein
MDFGIPSEMRGFLTALRMTESLTR